MKLFEPFAWVLAIAVLSGLVAAEGRRRTELESRVSITAPELYRQLAKSQARWQIVDVREDSAFEDSHVPGAIPFPGCDPARQPAAAVGRVLPSVPTIIVSASGADPEVRRCLSSFTAARALKGGMTAWEEARLPEDSGEFSPPSVKAGGGCL